MTWNNFYEMKPPTNKMLVILTKCSYRPYVRCFIGRFHQPCKKNPNMYLESYFLYVKVPDLQIHFRKGVVDEFTDCEMDEEIPEICLWKSLDLDSCMLYEQ